VQLAPEPAIDISGASDVPVTLAIAAGASWAGHVPGPSGLPGGYPVRLASDGTPPLDLPPGRAREAAISWNASHEERNCLVVEGDGRVRYTGVLGELPELARGFRLADLEDVHSAMADLRARLQELPAKE
jgi:hypothetical protein